MCTSENALQRALDDSFDEGFDFCVDVLKDKLREAGVIDKNDDLVNYIKLPGVVMQFLADNTPTDDDHPDAGSQYQVRCDPGLG